MFVSDIREMTSGTVDDNFIIENVWNGLVQQWDKEDNYKTNYPLVRVVMRELRENQTSRHNRNRSFNLFCHDFKAIMTSTDQGFVMVARGLLWKAMPKERRVNYEVDRLTHFKTN
jgi:hypothetical protein